MRFWLQLSLVLAMMVSFGCPFFGGSSSDSEDGDTTVTEGTNDPDSVSGALGALKELAENAESMAEDMKKRGTVDAVHFSKLIELLPEAPSGWERSEPEGETSTMGGFEVSSANATYTHGEERVDVKITDTSFQQILVAPFMMLTSFSKESTSGYEKGIKVGEDPAREEYTYKSKRGERKMLLGKRFLYEIDIRNLEPAAFDEWTKRANVAAFREIAAADDKAE